MIRLILLVIFFLLSLLTLFRAPLNLLWYVSILITEFSWVFFIVVAVTLLWGFNGSRYTVLSFVIGIASLVLYAIPVAEALLLSPKIERIFYNKSAPENKALADSSPFYFWQLFTGIHHAQNKYQTIVYDTEKALTLDWYASQKKGNRPLVIVVHGGSWAGGDSQQLPELNTVLARNGYHVATINYRLAPEYKYPAPLEDVKSAIKYLNTHAESLAIDTSNIVLLGRSAGGQIVLSAAYLFNDASIKGVIDFYGPVDMVWGYANPCNPLVLDSRTVMEDYLGGTYSQVPQQYISSSATETATKASPPALLMYGENDPLVSHLHGVRLGKVLDSLQVPHYDIYLPWATHAFDWTLHGPGGQISTWSVLQFLKMVTGK